MHQTRTTSSNELSAVILFAALAETTAVHPAASTAVI